MFLTIQKADKQLFHVPFAARHALAYMAGDTPAVYAAYEFCFYTSGGKHDNEYFCSMITGSDSSVRQKQIVNSYIRELDKHIADLKTGNAETTYEIRDFAEILHIHPTHLSNTIHEVLGQSPCDLYEVRLLAIAKELLLEHNASIASVARHLMYDPSNFTKFFKHYEGITPKQFRERHMSI